MTKQQFLKYCLNTYGTSPDYPFDEDFETAVLRHADNRKWYAIVMRVGCFHVLAIINSVAMNIGVHVSLSILVSSVCMPSSGIAGS